MKFLKSILNKIKSFKILLVLKYIDFALKMKISRKKYVPRNILKSF